MTRRVQHAARRLGAAVAVTAVFAGGGVLAATPAVARDCPSGYVCTWPGINGGGTRTAAQFARNYTTTIASVNYNYQRVGASFWTLNGGRGERITGYTLGQQGFRTWSHENHNRARSHADRFQ